MVYAEMITLSGPSSALNQSVSSNVSGSAGNFTTRFNGGLRIEKGSKVALQSFAMTLSYTNISPTANNQTIGYRTASTDTTSTYVLIPEGSYNVDNINTYLEAIPAVGTNISLTINANTIQCAVTLAPGFSLDLTQGTLYQYLGFSSPILLSNPSTTGPQTTFSDSIVSINTVNLILVHCNLVNGSGCFVNGIAGNIIGSFPPSVGPGELQTYTPNQLVYINIMSQEWADINVYVTDQNNNQLDLNGQQVTLSIVFSK